MYKNKQTVVFLRHGMNMLWTHG